jgi:mRNA interferase RelE/StbE
MSYTLLYHPLVSTDDIPSMPRNLQRRLAKAIESRLTTAPERYGEPLRASSKGYWKLRVGDYRVVYKIVRQEVWILAILHRKKVYEAVLPRYGWEPPDTD